MQMKSKLLVLSAVLAFLPSMAMAHKAWILPSQTVNSGETPVVTFDAAISNDLFYFNHVPLGLDRIAVTAPDGSKVEIENGSTLKYRSVFDLSLRQQGTYRIAAVNSGLSASWTQDGKPKRWRGSPAEFATAVPANAADLKVMQSLGRIETFVTNGNPNDVAIKPVGQGLEVVVEGHPNDLITGEKTTFQLLLDGQPAAGVDVEIVRGATRYRNSQDEIKVKTDAQGKFSADFAEPGMYWLETATTDAKTSIKQAKERRLSYVATYEVLPE